MSEQPREETDTRSFDLWFYIFAILTVILVVRNQGLSVESAHSLIMMLFFKQMGIVWKNQSEMIERETNDLWLERLVRNLEKRLNRFDPYPDDKSE